MNRLWRHLALDICKRFQNEQHERPSHAGVIIPNAFTPTQVGVELLRLRGCQGTGEWGSSGLNA